MTWGLCATIKAPAADILRFAAYHIEHGAHRLYIYLDDDNKAAFIPLKNHPKVRVQICDRAYWDKLRGWRPAKHQARQTMNATHAYNRRAEVDWLIHMDADEFLVPRTPLSDALSALPETCALARVRPMEQLGGSGNAFKAFIPSGPARSDVVSQLYPTFGAYLRGGFVSHIAGKVFVRTGLPDVTVKIHNAFQGDTPLPGAQDLADIDLAHCHAASWDKWRAAYDYRLDKGSYREELKAASAPGNGGMNLHALFQSLAAGGGEEGLRAFYDEVIGDSPALRQRLQAHGLLRIADLNLDATTQKYFPDAAV
ncbi:MAG: glycosyltransferase family 2 protein [Pseudomonadota bacterium]